MFIVLNCLKEIILNPASAFIIENKNVVSIRVRVHKIMISFLMQLNLSTFERAVDGVIV
jgi:hypothetical protein